MVYRRVTMVASTLPASLYKTKGTFRSSATLNMEFTTKKLDLNHSDFSLEKGRFLLSITIYFQSNKSETLFRKVQEDLVMPFSRLK